MTTPIQTLLPPGGIGFTNYNHTPGDRYGTADTVLALGTIGLLWSMISDTPFAVGDISNRGGGKMEGHDSHKFGTDVDIRPLRHDNQNDAVTINDPFYSRLSTLQLVRVIRSAASIGLIYFNDLSLRSQGLTTYFAGHDNHLHVRFNAKQPPFALRFGLDSMAVLCCKVRLRELGYMQTFTDSKFDRATADAVRSFQKSRGLTRDGIIGRATLRELALALSQSS